MPASFLNEKDKNILLRFARQAIQKRLENKSPDPKLSLEISQPDLKAGCFVTLRRSGQLRGCIGTFDGSRQLVENIQQSAVSAAFEDPRFVPLSPAEFPDLKVEISVLGELKKTAVDQIQIGRDGVLVRYKKRSGTYLPEVAVEQGWSREQFVEHCALHKAGISSEDFQKAEIYAYEVIKFSE